RFACRLRVGDKAVGLPYPCNSEVLDIVAIDLVESGVTGASFVTSISFPVSVSRALLRQHRKNRQDRNRKTTQQEREPSHHVLNPPLDSNLESAISYKLLSNLRCGVL